MNATAGPAATMTDLELLKELAGEKCWCSAWKRRGYALCGPCFHRLTHILQIGLRERLGRGYREARAAAIAFLVENAGGN